MKALKVLHVASFQGNIGDNANHTGFRKHLETVLGVELIYTEFEIRKVFWKQKFFDEGFVELANSFDLVIVGGGNYFELWVEDSATGTSFDMSIELYQKIKTPVVFNALGVDPAQGAKAESVDKFRSFIDAACLAENTLFSCRNDGSMETLKDIVGLDYADRFFHVPDAGFFTEVIDCVHPEIDETKKNIVVQLAGDMIPTRFPNANRDDISYEQFIENLASVITTLCEEHEAHIILVPHIFRDLDIIYTLMDKLPDSVRRGPIAVAPYLIGQKGQDYIFDIYGKADLVIGMRFHANVCGLGLGTPSIGLVNYRQIDKLYEEMLLDEYKVYVNKQGFEDKLLSLSLDILNNKIDYPAPSTYLDKWKKQLLEFHSNLKDWLIRKDIL